MRKRTVLGWCALAAFFALTFPVSQARAQQLSPSDVTPKIDGFEEVPVAKALPGRKLAFTLRGSPGGAAVVTINGATDGGPGPGPVRSMVDRPYMRIEG